VQQGLGCRVEWCSKEEIGKRFPLYEASRFAGGTFGADDGYVDGHALLMGYKAKARALGARYVDGEVAEVCTSAGRVTGVRLASGEVVKSNVVVNCAGAWAAEVARTAGVDLPVQPVKRQVFALKPADAPEEPLPLTVLPSGLYFRSETGGLILLGKSLQEDPAGFDFACDRTRFTDVLWPELVEFVPGFDHMKLVRGWAGLYAINTLDSNAILGEWPKLKGFFLANGFSGHGLQQAPAAGRYLSELILGREVTLDLSIFHPQRILEKRPLSETGLV
jgi:glycine/D-amino acid oxidase-like deaminating enzyme